MEEKRIAQNSPKSSLSCPGQNTHGLTNPDLALFMPYLETLDGIADTLTSLKSQLLSIKANPEAAKNPNEAGTEEVSSSIETLVPAEQAISDEQAALLKRQREAFEQVKTL